MGKKPIAIALALAILVAQALAAFLIQSPPLRIAAVLGAGIVAALALLASSGTAKGSAPREPGVPDLAGPAHAPVAAETPAAKDAAAKDISLAAREADRSIRERRSAELLETCASLRTGVLERATALGDTRGSLEALRERIASLESLNKVIQENSKQVFDIADNLAGSAEQGFTLSRNVQTNVISLSEDIGSSLAETEKLLEESERISEILTIMSEISATTSILSINASIVAARAGAKGREFDVVAKEVRKLSIGTEEALGNISSLTKDIQSKISSVSGRLRNINAGIQREKESMLSVAGALQGVTLAVEVIRSVSGGSGEKTLDGDRGFKDALGIVDDTAKRLAADFPVADFDRLRSALSEALGGDV